MASAWRDGAAPTGFESNDFVFGVLACWGLGSKLANKKLVLWTDLFKYYKVCWGWDVRIQKKYPLNIQNVSVYQ